MSESATTPKPRQTYETDADRKREREFANDIEQARGVKLSPCKKFFHADFVIHDKDGFLLGLAELKIRIIHSNQHKSLILSKSKIDYAETAMRNCACAKAWFERGEIKPLFYIVFCRFLDKDMYHIWNEGDVQLVSYGGMNAPRDPQDAQDLLVNIPIERFKPLWKEVPNGSRS